MKFIKVYLFLLQNHAELVLQPGQPLCSPHAGVRPGASVLPGVHTSVHPQSAQVRWEQALGLHRVQLLKHADPVPQYVLPLVDHVPGGQRQHRVHLVLERSAVVLACPLVVCELRDHAHRLQRGHRHDLLGHDEGPHGRQAQAHLQRFPQCVRLLQRDLQLRCGPGRARHPPPRRALSHAAKRAGCKNTATFFILIKFNFIIFFIRYNKQ